MKIRKNLGGLDRILRGGIGIVMIYFGIIDSSVVTDEFSKILLTIMGSAMSFIAIIAHCPMYAVIGFDTCSTESGEPNNT